MKTIFIFIILLAVFGPLISPHDPLLPNMGSVLKSPGKEYLFGTDNQGRDVFARVLCGARISLGIGILATFTSVLLGLVIGLIAGYKGGVIDKILSILIDITLSFPSLLLAIGITVVLPSGVISVISALALAGWAGFARFTRGIVWNLRNSGYIESANALGAGTARIAIRHIMPNCLPLVIVTGFLKLGTFILSESGLSFLGLGIPPPTPTWGGMINYGRDYLEQAPWIVIFPGMALAITVIVCNMLGDVLRDKLDPKMRLNIRV